MSIESTLLDWLGDATGLDVWQAPIDNSMDKPSGEYLTFQIASIVMSEFNQSDGEVKNANELTKTVKNNAKMLLSVNIFSNKGYAQIAQLNASSSFWKYRSDLSEAGISVNRFGNPQNLTGLGDTNFVQRWQADIEFMLTIETIYDWDRLKQIQLGGKFLIANGVGEIQSVIKWPKV